MCFCDDEMMSKSHIQQREREKKKANKKEKKKAGNAWGPSATEESTQTDR